MRPACHSAQTVCVSWGALHSGKFLMNVPASGAGFKPQSDSTVVEMMASTSVEIVRKFISTVVANTQFRVMRNTQAGERRQKKTRQSGGVFGVGIRELHSDVLPILTIAMTAEGGHSPKQSHFFLDLLQANFDLLHVGLGHTHPHTTRSTVTDSYDLDTIGSFSGGRFHCLCNADDFCFFATLRC